MPRNSERTPYVPIDERDPATVRAVILARKSGPSTRRDSDSPIDPDVQTQVERCQRFIERIRWNLVADPYAYTEKNKSGYYRVERPVLDAVLQLAQRGEVDVIVASEFERVDRTKTGRYLAMGTAEKYGVEFRFENQPPNGKLPDTLEGKIYRSIQDDLGEIERDRIVERTTPGRERRYAEGKPAGGRAGPPYGYTWPDKKKRKTYDAFIEDPTEYPILREMFERVANDERVSTRSLAMEFDARGIPTPTGKGAWSASTISRIIRNPIYCGRGRTKRWRVEMEPQRRGDNRQVHDYRKVYSRQGTDTYLDETFPLAAGAVPVLIEPELWDQAQKALTNHRTFNGKLERANSTRPAEATLLHGGLVRCANCGSWMIRMWPKDSTKVQYRCNSRASNPNQDCPMHQIPASAVDAITLRKVATVLSDPEQIVALADAAEAQAEQAAAAVDLADTKLAVMSELVAQTEQEREGYLSAIKSLSAIPGNENTITDLRAKLARLDLAIAQARESATRALPEYERAQRRQQMLDRISRFRNEDTIIDLLDIEVGGEIRTIVQKVTHIKGSGERKLNMSVQVEDAAELLGMSEATIRAMGTDGGVRLVENPEADPEGAWIESIETWKVIYLLLQKAPHARVRQLLRDLGVQVLIKHPWPKEERAVRGRTPPAERVIVKFLADPQDADQLRPSQANSFTFA